MVKKNISVFHDQRCDEDAAFFTFVPRPNRPELFDEQSAFIDNQDTGVAFHIGGNGCLGGETLIQDAIEGWKRPISEIKHPFWIWSVNPDTGLKEIRRASAPFCKGTAPLLRITFSDYTTIRCTAEHAFVTDRGYWIKAGQLRVNDELMVPVECNKNHIPADVLDSTATDPSNFVDSHPQRFNSWDSISVSITKIELCDTEPYWDISVPPHANYVVGGIVHANSGTSTAAACKIARLLLTKQEAPRYDCPFWVVGNDFAQTIESMWREKLYGLGFLPDCEINFDRITWHDKRRELPATVPLKPWVNGNPRKNWVIEFRSFAQGRMAMQARALGGFCLTEQFPWEILVEILRGMRQHNIPGSKFCEFTPVDPVLSAPLKEMMETNTLPKGWAVYRANTLCNVLDPNSPVDQDWYDEFFNMVGDELYETRKTGAWASYEGLIYKSFNPRVHFVENAPIPRNAIHKRGVDWGGGPYNALVVLWGCKDDKGNWLIYDEYYTTDSVTWEERIRAIHQKDGWSLVMDHPGPPASYRLEPHPEVPVRWRYDMSTFGPTYAPPDDPGAFRECRHYCLPVVQGKTGLSNSYHPSIECIQAMLRYTPEEFKAGTAPLLKIDRARCPNLAREMQILRWQVPPSHATNPRAPKPLQIKDQDHAPDALRALIYSDWIDMQSGVAGHRVPLKERPQVRHHRGR